MGLPFKLCGQDLRYNPELNRLDPGNPSKFVNVVKSSLIQQVPHGFPL